MKIVIDISENKYQNIKKAQNIFLTPLELIIKNGVPLKNERPKGTWEYKMQISSNPYVYICSKCGYHNNVRDRFCPYCGAEMEVEK